MKKFIHPKKNKTLIISQNGASNYGEIYQSNYFSSSPFDIRTLLEVYNNTEEITNENNIINFINEYKYTTHMLWSNLEPKNK